MSTYIGKPVVTYKLKFTCAHENIEVKGGEVTCLDCDGKDITQEEAVSILESAADYKASVEEERLQQDG